MPTLNTEAVLSGAAEDVLHALFFRGALPSGDLPSKAGAQELRELGLAETRTTEYKYHGEDYFTWLTQKGQQVAIERIGGKNPQCHVATMKLEIDTSSANELLEEIDSKVREASAFSTLACTADLSTPGPEDTLHHVLIAALPEYANGEFSKTDLRERAEALAVAINAAYEKLNDK